MTYDPEANEAMQKPDTMGASASEANDQQRASKPNVNKKSGNRPNNVRKIRIERMMSKAELARRANLSVLTIDRVEKGFGCRMDTKRKILEALGLRLADRVRVFGEEE
jgi:DNA-binding XRE family transcriptional regulator